MSLYGESYNLNTWIYTPNLHYTNIIEALVIETTAIMRLFLTYLKQHLN